ncbi:MAG: glycerol-phosphatase [Actinomycetota bacterium]|nr:glycerol-phosphatase [Actinomycetota bacterium]
MTEAQPARGSRLGSCDRPLCEAYDAALYDLDGVLYLGAESVAHAADSVARATSAGMRSAFVTNNASRPPATVAAHLRELGIPAEAGDVVTSAQATARLLREQLPEGATVLVVGAKGLVREVRNAGFVAVEADSPDVRAVVQGYGPDVGMRQLAEAALALRRGAIWIAANTDTTLPSPRGLVPGNGALVAALRVSTGREPQVAGKPERALHAESVARVGAARPLVVGDRLDTDVLGAVHGGADSLLVLTGVADAWDALTAADGTRPTYIAWDLRGLTAPQPRVDVSGDSADCDGASASYEGGHVAVTGEGAAALRAACALAWRCADEGRPVTGVSGLEQ